MYTVIFAEQEYIDNIREYRLFLEPFMQKSRFAFCRWEPYGDSLAESVPDLGKLIVHRDEWRAVILCDEEGLEKKNPFDLVKYDEPKWDGRSLPMEEYYDARIAAKKAAYDAASEKPLVRLATRLCEDPQIRGCGSDGGDAVLEGMRGECEQMADLNEDKLTRDEVSGQRDVSGSLSYQQMLEYENFREYRECALYKKELRLKIRGGEPMPFSVPTEVLCIAKRHCDDADYALSRLWNKHDESDYSRFYDWNMYYDKMRYLVYDIGERTKQNYQSDYIRFILGVFLIAGNDLPSGALKPNRVYALSCEMDKEKMRQLFGRYDAKMDATKAEISERINDIRTSVVKRLSDGDAERIFAANISIPINFSASYDMEDLTCNEKFGLSFDCPVDDEETVWTTSCQKNKKALKKLAKQPPRAISRATDDFRKLNRLEESRAAILNEYQVDDLKEHIDTQERAMVDTYTRDVYDAESYFEEMDEKSGIVKDEMGKRMRRAVTIFWGVLSLALVFVGVVPFFLANRNSQLKYDTPLPPTVFFAIIALVCVAVAALVCLFVFRHALKEKVKDYNNTMYSIVGEMEADVNRHGTYLSHAANVMRGNSAVAYYEEHADGDDVRVRILAKHVKDIEEQQALLKDIFGRFMDMDGTEGPVPEQTAYDYDFTLPRDYVYPMPDAPDLIGRAEFMERGNYIDIPYGIIGSLRLGREELYD